MRNLFTLLLFVFFLNSAWATNYYFSSVSGDDSRTATQAQNPSTPWKTLNKLNAYFTNFQPGDSILLKRGETFYGSIIASKSGTVSLPIVISAYGAGNKPLITSLVTVNNWVSTGNGIWESYNPSLSATLNTVLLNDQPQQLGRYPNRDAANKGYLTFESHGSSSITDTNLTAEPNWTGAQLVLRSRRWVLDRDTIKLHSGNTINFTAASSYSPVDGYGYFIQNDIRTLDQLGEWYYNSSAKKLSVYFGANSPSSYSVQATSITNLIYSYNYSNIVFDNLNIKGANSDGIYIRNGSNMNIKNCDILYSGGNGITVKFHTGLKIENCTVSYSNGNGIDLGFGGDNAVIRNNRILNTAVFAGMGGSGDSQGLALQTNGNGSIIEYNEMRNTGYIGIYFGGDNVTVKNNLIDSFCTTKDDGSAIYTFTGSANTPHVGRKVFGNIVMDGVGASEGTNDRNILAEGIYIDDNSSGVEINGNTVANIPGKGIFLHNARGITVTNNTSFNNKSQLTVLHDTKANAVRNCIITNNNFFSKSSSQNVATFKSIADDNNLIGRLDSNYYTRPIDDRLVISNSYVNSLGVGIAQDFELEGWKGKYGMDISSNRSAKQIASYKLNSLTSTNKVGNGTFTSNINGVSKSLCNTAWSNAGQLDGGYLQVNPTSRGSSVYMKIGAVTAGKKYIVRYSVKGSVDSTTTLSVFLRQDGSPYATITGVQNRKLSNIRTENEMLFTPASSQTAATLVLSVNDQVAYSLDNLQVYEADASITNIDDSLKFVYNAGPLTKTVSLDGSYVDVKNNKYLNSITLQPYQSAVLVKSAPVAPSVAITSPAVNSSVAAPATITISATATDSDGTISKVEFYNNDTLLGAAAASPYTFTWKNLHAGKYTITAKATDNSALTATSAAVTFSVYKVAPSVSIISPVANASVSAPASVTISATATDSDGTISKVEFYNNDTLLGTSAASPYTYTWNKVSKGSYLITAKAFDNDSLSTTSQAVAISVYTPNVAPTVSITSPVSNATFAAPSTVTISATAADTDGTISKVEFYNNDTLLGTATASPYTFTWNNVPKGTYSITAKATDNGLLTTTSTPIYISVYTPNVAPAVSITSPVANATFAALSTVTISAAAADSDGTISKVEFYNNDTLLGTATASPYTFTWINVPKGTYSITAKATDNGSLTTTSSAVTISVYTPNIAPSVSLTSPVATAKYTGPTTINMAASASDPDGTISSVKFYNGTTYLKTVLASPYTYSMTNVAAGTYTITAKAIDNNGAETISAPVTVTVLPNIAPSVSITSPIINARFSGPATINISAKATDSDGSISKVDFYNGTTLLKTITVSPYTYSWQNVPAGNYTIIAKATDNKGAVTTSAGTLVSVTAQALSLRSSQNHEFVLNTTNALNESYNDLNRPDTVKTADVRVYPNPATSKIQIIVGGELITNQKGTLSITTLSGIIIKRIPIIVSTKTLEADVTSLTPGMYIVSIISDNLRISKKFIKN